ncbi:hypothetical protein SERLA73DRAFT_150522 [Serpula lacrymans var. lacrymans S7.3]|uniref:Uncharacterized protein n=1 Tax=Serpula lacrymans var. lacrymans (strain S7.3) TaxID=936435 RepID=F8PMX3_SERL3|nr:hypothetical protein SERLA73DRAFT_150522 [Serpula lacrymans var. lacrymans S7.3]
MVTTPAVSLMRGPLLGALIGLLYPGDRRSLKAVGVRNGSRWNVNLYYGFLSNCRFCGRGLVVLYSKATFIIGFVIEYVVNLYFIWRVWKHQLMWSISVISGTGRSGVGIAACAFTAYYHSWYLFHQNALVILLVGNIMYVVGDAATACILAYYYLHAGRSDLKSSKIVEAGTIMAARLAS